MILSRETQQKKISDSFNRNRLLKLGFQHISLSVFANKFYQDLTKTAEAHYKKVQKKFFFKKLHLNSLIYKRINIIKTTGFRLYRKNSLLKGLRKLYSNSSLNKNHREKSQTAFNYHVSNLYLKSLVSWQNYHSGCKEREKINFVIKKFFSKKKFSKFFSA